MPQPRKRQTKSGAATPKPAETHCAGDDYEPTESEPSRRSGDWRPKPAEETQSQKSKAAGLLTLLKNTRVFFYPACCFDWRPLLRFGLPGSFDCQTFVYCDWLRDLAGAFNREFAEFGRNLPPGHELQCESVRDIQPHELTGAGIAAPLSFLRPDEITNYRRSFEQFATQDGWGRLAKLRHIANGEQRDLTLVYLGAEGVATYLQVFRAQQIAPYMLCTVNCGVGFGCGWTDFRLCHEALGRAADLAPPKPEYVVNEGHPPYDWPWNELVQDFGDMKVFRRPCGTLKTGTEHPIEKGTEAASTPGLHDSDIDMPTIGNMVDAENTKFFLKQAATGNVFFCPGCLSDYNVLARFSDVCRVFIFCRKTQKGPTDDFPLENCPEFMRTLFSFQSAGAQGDLDLSVFGKAGLLTGCRSGYYRWLWRKVDAEVRDFSIERRMLAVFLNIDPVRAYTDLFIKRNVAPKYVSLHKCGWQPPMRETLLQAGQAQPKYLVADWPEVYGPWTWRRRQMRTWGTAAVFARRTDLPHPAIAVPQGDNLEFTIGRLTPNTINGADGVLVSLQDYLAYAWPQPNLKILIDSTDEQTVAEIRARDRRVERLPVHERPLSEVLPALARACVRRCIHSNVLGFEDEAEGILRAWPGIYRNLHLVVHGEPADWASLDWDAAPDLPYPGLPNRNL